MVGALEHVRPAKIIAMIKHADVIFFMFILYLLSFYCQVKNVGGPRSAISLDSPDKKPLLIDKIIVAIGVKTVTWVLQKSNGVLGIC
jgi:hypothetical protein